MPNAITRSEAEALIQEQLIATIMQDTPKSSVFMSMARKLPNMTSKTTRMLVLDMLPTAYWVNGDTGFKQTTQAAWDKVYMNAEELAVIVPIPEAVLDDASFDILGEVQPRIVEAIGRRVDDATIFGINRPAGWPLDIVSRARQAGNNVAPGSSPDYYDLIMGENGVIAKVEESGYMVTGALSSMGMRAKLRGPGRRAHLPDFHAGRYPVRPGRLPHVYPPERLLQRLRRPVDRRRLLQGSVRDPPGHHRQDPGSGHYPGPHYQGDRV